MSEAELIVLNVLPKLAIDHFTRLDRQKMYVCLADHITEVTLSDLTVIAERLGTCDIKVALGARRTFDTGLYILIQGIKSEP